MEDRINRHNTTGQSHKNMTGFIIIWIGQFFSMTGSFMTSFALAIWAWEKTGSAQAMALVGVFTYAPLIIVTPFVGGLVDRWNRKLVMMLSDICNNGICQRFSSFSMAGLFSIGVINGAKAALQPCERTHQHGGKCFKHHWSCAGWCANWFDWISGNLDY
jgi:MFS family permease